MKNFDKLVNNEPKINESIKTAQENTSFIAFHDIKNLMQKTKLIRKINITLKLISMFDYNLKYKTTAQKILEILKHPKHTFLVYKQARDLQKTFEWRIANEKYFLKKEMPTPQIDIDMKQLSNPHITDNIPNPDGEHIQALNKQRCKKELGIKTTWRKKN
jgi:hypothetical protein